MATTAAALSGGVGLDGPNRKDDVHLVQQLLNQHRHRITGSREVAVDGIIGPKTIAAIKTFQRTVVQLRNPDGQVDVKGRTIAALFSSPPAVVDPPRAPAVLRLSSALRFPLRKRPEKSYKTGGRWFGAPRDNGNRRHAGCDLLASPGTEVLAMADGEIYQDAYYFYSGTNALEVRHEGGWIARYGEISTVEGGLKKGGKVKRGQVIARVGQLNSGSSMLHLEMYAGSGSGNLTVRSTPPFQRRGDLVNPTSHLDSAVLE